MSEVSRYPGLRPFQDDRIEQKLFKGRDAETQILYNRVVSQPLVLLFGKSGNGKSSLVNAGLVPLLRDDGFFPVVARIRMDVEDPLLGVFESIQETAAGHDVELTWDLDCTVWHFFKRAKFKHNGRHLTPVIILDQFEELFNIPSRVERTRFIRELSDLVRGHRPEPSPNARRYHDYVELDKTLDDRPPRVHVLLSMREDYLAEASELTVDMPRILKSRVRLGPLEGKQAIAAIVEPGGIPLGDRQETLRWDNAALDRIAKFIGITKDENGEPVGDADPFQIQLACQQVERAIARRHHHGESDLVVTLDDVKGLDGLLRTFYSSTIEEISEAGYQGSDRFGATASLGSLETRLQRTCEDLINENNRRRSVEMGDLAGRHRVPPQALLQLAERRILRRERRGELSYFELSHDSLINPVQHVARDRRKRLRRYLKIAVGAFAVALLGGIVAVKVAFDATRDARAVSDARFLLYEVKDPLRASTMLMRVDRSVPGWAATAHAILAQPVARQDDPHLGAGVRDVRISPDGRLLLTASMDQTSQLAFFTPTDGTMGSQRLEHHAIVRAIAFSADGQWAATGSADGELKVWSMRASDTPASETGNAVATAWCDACPALQLGRAIRSIAFHPSEPLLAVASDNGTARMIRYGGPEAVVDSIPGAGDETEVTGVAFSRSGNHIALASQSGEIEIHRGTINTGWTRVARFPSPNGNRRSVEFVNDTHLLLRERGGGAVIWNRTTDSVATLPWPAGAEPERPTPSSTNPEQARIDHEDLEYAEAITGAAVTPGLRWLMYAAVTRSGDIVLGRYTPQTNTLRNWVTNINHPGGGDVLAAKFIGGRGSAFHGLTARSDGTIRLWRRWSTTGPNAFTEISHPGLTALDVSRDRTSLVTASRDGTTHIWDLRALGSRNNNPLLTQLNEPPVFSIDSLVMFARPLGSDSIQVWERHGSQTLLHPKTDDWLQEAAGHRLPNVVPFGMAVFSPDGQVLGFAAGDSITSSVELVREDLGGSVVDIPSLVTHMTFDSHGDHMIVNAVDSLRIIDVATGADTALAAEARAVRIDRATNRIMAVTDSGLRRWEMHGEELPRLDYPDINHATFTRSGQNILINAGPTRTSTALIWNGNPNEAPVELQPRHGVNDAAIDPTGRRVAVGSWDGAIVYRLDGSRASTLYKTPPSDGQVELVAFSPVGDRLVTVTDNSATVWADETAQRDSISGYYVDRETGLHLTLPDRNLEAVGFTPDGGAVVLVFERSQWIWRVSEEALFEQLSRLAGGN